MYEFLLLDLDDTILDFQKAEHLAVAEVLRDFGLTVTPQVLQNYSAINRAHWERLEKGELTREQVVNGRFTALFHHYGKTVDAPACAKAYEKKLSQGHYFLPGAEEAVKRLAQKYRLFLVSNGTASVQDGRLTSAGLYPYFEIVFISQQIGANKPAKEYFDRCFAQIPGFCKEKAIIVGDSLTSDILGGINAGIATCWVNTRQLPPRADIVADHEIKALSQLEALLDRVEKSRK